AAPLGGEAEDSRRSRLAGPVLAERLLDGGDAGVGVEEVLDGGAAEDAAGGAHRRRAPSSPPRRASTGAAPRRETRAPGVPTSRNEPPCARTIEPSRRPAAGVAFSSRNWRMRSSCVSPMCVLAGSGSRKWGLIWNGTRPSASKDGGWTMGMSLVVPIVGPA